MAFLFGRGRRSPAELVRNAKSAITVFGVDEDEKAVAKATEKVSANLSSMKFMFYGDGDHDPKPELMEKLVDEIFAADLLLDLLQHIKRLEFEARKDVAAVFNFLLRRGQHNPAVRYVQAHPEILQSLVGGYNDSDIALNCGSILRECIRHDCLNTMLLQSALFYEFFEFVQKSNFDIASDAFATFKLMLTKHKNFSAGFLEKNYDDIFERYNKLIQSDNYVTKRQSLKLLGEILLDRKNYAVMIRYINDPDNLKIIMNLLRGPSKTIQFEAFHVFKVFVANPKKAQPVLDILVRNKAKLIDFLKNFQRDKDDDQFAEEKSILLSTLSRLEPPE